MNIIFSGEGVLILEFLFLSLFPLLVGDRGSLSNSPFSRGIVEYLFSLDVS